MRAILTNPDMMREIMTPQNMTAAMGMMNQGGPGGMGAMGGMPGSMPMPGAGAGAGAGAGMGGMGGPGMGGMGGPGMGGMGMDPMMMQYMQMQGMGGMGGPGMGGLGSPAMGGMGGFDARPPREKYASQLTQIKEMGFTDEETILRMLEECGGNVAIVMDRLFAGSV
jgi:hypothetical protein